MIKKFLTLFILLINLTCLAAETQQNYESESVSLTAKISSFFWSTGGALLTSGAVVWKCAPIRENMSFNEVIVTGVIGASSLFTTSVTFAYVGKNIGKWTDPVVQYFRRHNSIFMYLTNKIMDGWSASVYYANHSYYQYKNIRRSYFQGTFYEDKSIAYLDRQ